MGETRGIPGPLSLAWSSPNCANIWGINQWKEVVFLSVPLCLSAFKIRLKNKFLKTYIHVQIISAVSKSQPFFPEFHSWFYVSLYFLCKFFFFLRFYVHPWLGKCPNKTKEDYYNQVLYIYCLKCFVSLYTVNYIDLSTGRLSLPPGNRVLQFDESLKNALIMDLIQSLKRCV